MEQGKRKIPKSKSQEPIRAVKLAMPVVKGNRVWWRPLYRASDINGRAAVYGNDEEARCRMQELAQESSLMVRFQVGKRLVTPEEHGPPPMLTCTCGFYALMPEARRNAAYRRAVAAYQARRRAGREGGATAMERYAVLDVELMGKVIVHELGYRAQRQRVMKAHLDGRCALCGKAARGFFAPTFVSGAAEPALLTSTCGCQQPVMYTLQDVRNMAGTEVVFDRDRQPLLTALLEPT